MAKTDSKRKTRSDKFLLTLHKTGQYCKKIKGKLYYFGTDKKACPSEKPYPDEKLKPRLMSFLICYPCQSRQMG